MSAPELIFLAVLFLAALTAGWFFGVRSIKKTENRKETASSEISEENKDI